MEYQLTDLLIGLLRRTKASPRYQALALVTVETDEQMMALCKWIAQNLETTDEELLLQARKIVEAMPSDETDEK